jgi:hypothetical protein
MVYGYQLKDIKIKNILPTLIVTAIFVWLIWFVLVKQGKLKKNSLRFANPNPNPVNNGTEEQNYAEEGVSRKLPNYYNLTLRIDLEGRKAVFPFTLVKTTPGPIELPNRRSLINKDTKYKYIDVMQGEKINIVSLVNLSYTVDHFVFNDDFLVTDKDYIVAYSQAVNEFELA